MASSFRLNLQVLKKFCLCNYLYEFLDEHRLHWAGKNLAADENTMCGLQSQNSIHDSKFGYFVMWSVWQISALYKNVFLVSPMFGHIKLALIDDIYHNIPHKACFKLCSERFDKNIIAYFFLTLFWTLLSLTGYSFSFHNSPHCSTTCFTLHFLDFHVFFFMDFWW